MVLTACSKRTVTKYEVLIFEPPEFLLEERFVEIPKLKTNKDLVNLIAKYKLQLDLSNDDKKILKMYLDKQKEDKLILESKEY